MADDMTCTEFCLFKAQEDMETMQAYAQVNTKAPFAVYYKKYKNHIFRQDKLHSMLCVSFQVFNKLIRRYKYLEKGFEEEIKKVCLHRNI